MKTAELDSSRISRAPGNAGRGNLPDLFFLLLLGVFWVYYVTPIVTLEKRYGGDILRDTASALNIQHGQFFADPAYRGETIWYPPLSPMIVAGVSALLGITPTQCYVWSQLLFNWMIPAGLYLVVRLQWGRRAAMAAVIALLLALPWWQTSVCRGQASVHAVVLGWVSLILYGLQHERASWRWPIACGLWQGLAFWHHPLLPAVLAAAFFVQALWAGRGIRRDALIVGITLLVAVPILYFMLHGPVLNPEPREYLADELRTTEFPLMHGNLWILGMGLIGLISSARSRSVAARLLVVGVGLTVAGQVWGYWKLFGLPGSSHLPVVVPHEFQLLFQLAWAICVGVGIERALAFVVSKVSVLRGKAVVLGAMTLPALMLTGVWGISDIRPNLRHFLHHYGPRDPGFPGAADWVRRNTDINDLIMCDVDLAFAWLGPQTGRKVWVTGHGHGNPRVDWHGRMHTLEEMRALADPRAFWQMARRCGVDYCILSGGWSPRVLTDRELGPITVPRFLVPVYVTNKIHILKVCRSGPRKVGIE
ncbi:MAG: hypothetical protein KAV82_11125 [Phycisphaerae bacterium]|nr:hypothetical protein [Phycisphaerae bacterium]